MQVLKQFNNISKELREECIPVLEIGEVRRFKMLTGVVNNDPDYNERQKRPIFYGNYQIPCKDRIKDPYAPEKSKQFVEIGVVEMFDPTTEMVTKLKTFVPGINLIPGLWNGEFYVTGGNNEDEELFEYLCITNYNEDFKYRNKNVTPLFREINEDDESDLTALPLQQDIEQFAKHNPQAFAEIANRFNSKVEKKKVGRKAKEPQPV